jgi:P27 family predicted phage terminase small subunit
MRGRKPHPTWRKQLEGNPGKRKRNREEPQPPAPEASAFDEPPPELAGQLVAQGEWRRLAPMLRAGKQITDADKTALIALCAEWGRYVEALRKVFPEGRDAQMVVVTPSGYPMPNPYLAIATKALAGCAKLWPELGLTPSSRSRVKLPGDEPTDPFSKFDTPPPINLPRTTTH